MENLGIKKIRNFTIISRRKVSDLSSTDYCENSFFLWHILINYRKTINNTF